MKPAPARCLWPVIPLLVTLCAFVGSVQADDGASGHSTSDADVQWNIGMRLQLDRHHFANDGGTPFSDRWNTRRARISGSLSYQQRIHLDLTYDFARDGISGIRDAYLAYQPSAGTELRAGHFKEPFGLERLTSVRDLAFMERSLASEVAPERAVGIAFHHWRSNHTAGIGVFSGSLDPDSDIIRYSVSGRLTFAPRNEPGDILHVGMNLSYRQLESDATLSFGPRPETRGTDSELLDTGSLITDTYRLYGLEAALARDSLALQADYLYSDVPDARLHPADSGRHARYRGWHLDASWIMTGEKQPYNREKGTFGRLTPLHSVNHGGRGAWKAGLRVSELDLNTGGLRGGRQRNLTAGLTWLLNPHVSLYLEHVRVLRLRRGDYDGASPSLTQARLQLVY